MEVEQDVDIECPNCGHEFEQTVTLTVEPEERDFC